jgi:hypothetical protein
LNSINTVKSKELILFPGLLGEELNSDEMDQPRNQTYTELSPVKFSNVTSDEIYHQQNFTSTCTSTEIVQDDLLVENAASNSNLDPCTSAEILIQDGNLNFQAEKSVTTTSRNVSQVGDLNFLTVDVSENREIIEAIDMDFHETINTEHTDISQHSSFNVPYQDRDIECGAEETFIASDYDNDDEDYLPSRRNRTYTELSPVKFSNVTSDEIDHQQNFTSTCTSTEIVQDDLLVENAASNSDLDPCTSAEILIQDGNLDFQAEKTVTTTSRNVSQVGDLNFLTVDVSENREIIEAIDVDFHETINTEHTDISQLSSFNVPNQDRDIECGAEETFIASDYDNDDEDYLPSRRNRTYTELSPVKFSNVTSDEIDHQQNFTSTCTSTEIVQDDLLVENAASNSDLDPCTSAEILIQDGNLDFQAEKTVTTTSRNVSQVGDLNFLTVDVSENREIIEAIDVDFHETINTEHTDISQLSSFNVPNQDRDIECGAEETFIANDCDNDDEDYLPSRSDSEDSEVEVPRKRKRILTDIHKKDDLPSRSDKRSDSEDSKVEIIEVGQPKEISILTEVHDNVTDVDRIPTDGEDKIKKRSRWTKENKNNWKREKNKSLRDSCLPYSDYKGNLKAKKPKPIDCSKCIYKCNEIFNEEERIRLCEKYWALSTFERKKDLILINVAISEPKSRRPRINDGCARANAKQYFFSKNDSKFRVCMAFFTKTLCISNRAIISAFSGKDEQGFYALKDNRGKKSPANKTPDNIVNKVKKHIESFPSVESHYVRKSSKRQYLDKKLSISKMYALYVEKCKEDGDEQKDIVSEITYRRTFCNNYNYSFFHPKKDQCVLCNRFENSTVEQKADLEHEYNEHRRRHSEAQEEKRRDKERANTDNTFMSVTFDLQSVLQLPSCDVSLAYYKRKLNAFNFTIYEASAPNNGLCFFWTEIDGHRGSSEIGTCLLKYIENLPDNIKHLTLFSDTCGGQNRNLQVAALLLNAVQIFNVDIIEQKFLESGHSFMEVDSMHSSIESKKKFMPIYCVNDYINIFKLARASKSKSNKPPYRTCQLSFSDFLDLKNLSDQLIKNKNVDDNGKKINWLKVKCFKYEKSAPNILQYKYNYSEDYTRINIICARRPGRRPTSSSYKQVDDLKKLALYKTQISITKQKKNDLLDLCRKGVIPEIFHPWYESLPTSDTAKEVLPIDNEEEL